MYCIDASVMTAVFDKNDKFHITSFEFINYINRANIKVTMPNLMLVELAGALARKGNPLDDIAEYLDLLKRLI
jgi:predicted nucleic acid-binding protein